MDDVGVYNPILESLVSNIQKETKESHNMDLFFNKVEKHKLFENEKDLIELFNSTYTGLND